MSTTQIATTNRSSARMLAEAGVMIALAKVLSFIQLFEMPLGGSVTLAAMAPIMFFAIRWGLKQGLFVGAVYGLIDFILKPYVVHPLQVIIDYPLAYAMLGFAALALIKHENAIIRHIPGMILAVFLRFVMHVISGCIFFSSIDFTKEGATLAQALSFENLAGGFGFSISYNATYLVPDLIICIVVILLLGRPIANWLNRSMR